MIKCEGDDIADPEKFWTQIDKINDLGMRVVVKQNRRTNSLFIHVSKDGVDQYNILSLYNHGNLYHQIAIAEYQVGVMLAARKENREKHDGV